MKKIALVIILLFIHFLATTCVEPISLKIKEEAPKLVVDGQINNQDDSCVVRLSYTKAYLSDESGNNTTSLPAIADRVQIIDDEGNQTELMLYKPGIYVTKAIKGKVGNTYILKIEMPNGKEYQSIPETLPDVANITKISHEVVEDKRYINSVLFTDIKVEIKAHFQDPILEKNYYKWKWLGETTMKFKTFVDPPPGGPNPIPSNCYYKFIPYLSDPYQDELTIEQDENFDGLDHQAVILSFGGNNLDFRFYSGVNMMIAQYSLTKNAYNYWEKMKKLIGSQGSIFDPTPFSVRGNIYNVEDENEPVLGYFGASSVKYIRYQFFVSKPRTTPPCPPSNPPPMKDICLDCRNLGPDYSLIPPAYWQF